MLSAQPGADADAEDDAPNGSEPVLGGRKVLGDRSSGSRTGQASTSAATPASAPTPRAGNRGKISVFVDEEASQGGRAYQSNDWNKLETQAAIDKENNAEVTPWVGERLHQAVAQTPRTPRFTVLKDADSMVGIPTCLLVGAMLTPCFAARQHQSRRLTRLQTYCLRHFDHKLRPNYSFTTPSRTTPTLLFPQQLSRWPFLHRHQHPPRLPNPLRHPLDPDPPLLPVTPPNIPNLVPSCCQNKFRMGWAESRRSTCSNSTYYGTNQREKSTRRRKCELSLRAY